MTKGITNTEGWKQRWRDHQIGWHKDTPNALLIKHLDRLRLSKGDTVLVPLCGKSLDLGYLAERGFKVIGAEVSELAAAAYFSDRGVTPEVVQRAGFQLNSAEGVEIVVGDFFRIEPADLAAIDGIWDRAALIAVEPAHTARYVEHLTSFLSTGQKVLLVSIEYDPTRLSGPPYSVSPSEIQKLFASHELELLDNDDVLSTAAERFKSALTWLREQTWLITLR